MFTERDLSGLGPSLLDVAISWVLRRGDGGVYRDGSNRSGLVREAGEKLDATPTCRSRRLASRQRRLVINEVNVTMFYLRTRRCF
mmetsp:Transcript_8864/g.19179  ORF Transcript_8864/g.19179 Transcript_8864/m.19179 type:complete len:85 (-) Transcript_8864:19-273(-)